MNRHRYGLGLVVTLLAACAAPPPIAFDLVDDQAKIHRGAMNPSDHSMAVDVNGQRFQGFYIVATMTGWTSFDPPLFKSWMRPQPGLTTVSTNVARAALVGPDQARLSCEFFFQGPKVAGECRGGNGKVFQLMAGTDAPLP